MSARRRHDPRTRGFGPIACALAAAFAVGASPTIAAPQRTSEHAAAEPAGKPVGPIAIRYALAEQPALGRPLAIEVTVTTSVPITNLRFSVDAEEGLVLVGGAPRFLGDLAPAESYRVSLTVMPLVLDVLYLNVFVAADVEGAAEAGTALIPVRLAAAKSRAAAPLKPDPAGAAAVHALSGTAGPSGRMR